jgi:hypothetical protein
MLIQNDFLKAHRLKNGRFLDPIRGRFARVLSTIREAVLKGHRTAISAVQIGPALACRRGLFSKACKHLILKRSRARLT